MLRSEYFLNCQYQPAKKAEMLAGCDVIRSTFAVTGATQ